MAEVAPTREIYGRGSAHLDSSGINLSASYPAVYSTSTS